MKFKPTDSRMDIILGSLKDDTLSECIYKLGPDRGWRFLFREGEREKTPITSSPNGKESPSLCHCATFEGLLIFFLGRVERLEDLLQIVNLRLEVL